MADTKQIKIKLVKSLIGCSPAQRKVAQSLGLSKTDQVVEHYNSANNYGYGKQDFSLSRNCRLIKDK